MIKLGLIGNGFVGGAARQLAATSNIVCVYDLDPEKCMPKGTTLEDVAACDLVFVAVPTPSRKDGTCHTDIVVSVVAALKKANGSLLPFGWYHLLQAQKKNNRASLYLIGIDPEYQGKGVTAIIFEEVQLLFNAKGIDKVETNPGKY